MPFISYLYYNAFLTLLFFFMLIDLKTYKKLFFFNYTQNSGFAPPKTELRPKLTPRLTKNAMDLNVEVIRSCTW